MDGTLAYLTHLQRLGVQLWLEGERLRFRAPAALDMEPIKVELGERKPAIVAWLRQVRAERDLPLMPRERPARVPLTLGQQRLWFLHALQPDDVAYNVHDIIEIRHAIDVPALERAFSTLLQRHELLRTRFPAIDGVPYQHIAAACPQTLPVIDLQHLDPALREQHAHRQALHSVSQPFDLSKGPLLRAQLFRLAPTHHLWVFCIHHIISDDWSKNLISAELEILYDRERGAVSSELAPLPVQWADVALHQHEWLRGETLKRHEDYWLQRLAGELPQLQLPTDGARVTPVRGRKGRFFFPAALALDCRRLAEAEGASLYMVLLTAYAVLLSRYSGQHDVIIGSPISDRNRIETEALIGFLLNTLPMRIQMTPGQSFASLLREVKQHCLDAYAHQAVPYESLMQRMAPGRDTSGSPLFQTLLTVLTTPAAAARSGGLWESGAHSDGKCILTVPADAIVYESEEGNGATMFDLSLTVIEHPEGLWGKTEYNADLFDEASVVTLVDRLRLLLQAAAAAPETPYDDLALDTDAQQQQVQQWSQGPSLTSGPTSLPALFEAQARLCPTVLAIQDVDAGRSLTYAELDAASNRLAAQLRARGIGPERRVGVLFERSIDQFVAILAVLKSGGACVPLDPTYPDQRLAMIVADARVALVLADDGLSARPALDGTVVLTAETMAVSDDAPAPVMPDIDPAGLACILYTSGSSGRPKGVQLTHRAQVSYILDSAAAYGIGADERILQFASIAFDASLEEAWLAFASGGTLVLRPERMIDTLDAFFDQVEAMALTTLVLPTVYWHALVDHLEQRPLPPLVRRIIIGGERLLPEKLATWQRSSGGQVVFFNTYGPTEGTISVTRHAPDRLHGTGREVPIGPPNANTDLHVLDARMRPVPAGIIGELYIGGLAVARGYDNRPGLTADCFVPDPFSAVAGARLYRTGDLARFLPGGVLQYRGRADGQVKIRGYRVEPREVELAMQGHPQVSDVVVTCREDVPGERRLIAYVVLRDNAADTGELRSDLRGQLPAYMVPAAIVSVPELPRNTNGKVDFMALPAPDAWHAVRDDAMEAPRTETERVVQEIWARVLQREHIGIRDNFFDLGGHSLLATRVVAHVNAALGVDLPLRRLFEAPTLADLGKVIDALERRQAQGDRPVSLQQLAGDGGSNGAVAEAAYMLDGLEDLTDQEIEALLGEDDDVVGPGAH